MKSEEVFAKYMESTAHGRDCQKIERRRRMRKNYGK